MAQGRLMIASYNSPEYLAQAFLFSGNGVCGFYFLEMPLTGLIQRRRFATQRIDHGRMILSGLAQVFGDPQLGHPATR